MQKNEVVHEKSHVVVPFNVIFWKGIKIMIILKNNFVNYNITYIINGAIKVVNFE